MAQQPIGIKVDVRFDSSKNVKEKLRYLLSDVQQASQIQINIDTKAFNKTFGELSKTLTDINKQIKETFNFAKYMDEQKKHVEDLTEQQIKYKKILGKSLNIGDGSKGFDELKDRASEIRSTVDALAKVSFNTTKNGAIKDATITYVDNMGKTVIETMKWKEVATEAENVIKRVFTTVNVAVSENYQAVDKVEKKLVSLKTNLQDKLNVANGNSLIDKAVIDNLQTQLDSINTDTPQAEIDKLKKVITNLSSQDSGIVRLQNVIEKFNNSKNSLDKKYSGLVGADEEGKRALEEYNSQLSKSIELLKRMEQGEVVSQQMLSQQINGTSSAFNKLTTSTKNSSDALRLSQKDAVTLGGALKDVATKVGLFGLAYDAFNSFKNGLRDGLQAVNAMDKAITTLSITMDGLTNESLNGMVKRSQELATSLKSTTTEILEMVTTFANAGETIDSIFNKTKSAVILQNLTGLSSEMVVDTIQSATKQFDALADGSEKSTMKVTDSMVAISKALGVDFSKGVKEMSESLSILGSLSQQLGGDLDSTLAIIAGGMEKLRVSGSEMATSLKTIMTRTMRIKGEGVSESDFSNAEKALNSIGIQIRNLNTGEMKNFTDIMNELNKQWDSLSESTQFYVGEQLGGVRQLSQVLGTIKNMPRINELNEIGKGSDGAGLEAQAKWADSLEAKYKELTNATQIFWQTFINSDAVKNGLDLLTSLVNGATKLTETFGSLGLSLGTLTGAFVMFTNNPIKNFFAELTKDANGNIVGVNSQFGQLAKQMFTVKNGTLGLVTAFRTAGGATALLSTGLKMVGNSALFAQIKAMALQVTLTMGLSLAITAVVGLISGLVSKFANAGESLREFNSESTELAENTSNTVSSARNLQYEIAKINEKLAVTTDINERNRLNEELVKTQSELANIMPETASGIDANGKAISSNNEIIEESIRLRQEELRLNALEFADKNKQTSDIEKYKEARKEYNEMLLAYTNGKGYDKEYTQSYNGMKEVKQQVNIEVDKDDLEDSKKKLQEINTYYSQLAKQVNSLKRGGFTDSEIDEILPNAISDLAEYNEVLKETSEKSKDTANSTDDFTESLDKLKEKSKETANAMAKNFDDAQKSIDFLTGLVDKLDSGKGISAKEIPEIMRSYPELLAYLDNEVLLREKINGLVVEEQEKQRKAFNTMTGDSIEYYNAKIKNNSEAQNQINKTLNSLVGSQADGYKVDLRNYNTLNEAKLEIARATVKSILGVQEKLWDYTAQDFAVANWQHGQVGGNWDDEASKAQMAKYNEIIKMRDRIREAMAQIDKLGSSGIGANFEGITSGLDGVGDKSQKEYKPMVDIFYALSNAIDDVNDKLDMNRKLQEKATGKDKIKLMQEEIALLKEQARLTQELTNKQIAEANRLKQEIAKQGGQFDKDGNLTNIDTLLNKTVTGDKAIEALKQLEEQIKEYTKLTQDSIPKTQQEWQELQNTIKDVYETQAKLVADTEKQIFDTIKYHAEKATNKKKEEIDKQIALLNKARDEENQEDEMNKKRNQLSDLKAEMDKYALATDKQGRLRFEQLKKQYEEMQDELNKTIQDNQHDALIGSMEEEKDSLDKALEDLLDPANINKIIQDALSSGYVTINGQVVSLQDATNQMLQETTVGTQNLVMQQKEYVTQLNEAYELMKKMQEINGNLGLGSGRSMTVPNTNEGIRSIPQSNVNNNFTVQVEVKGNADSQTAEQVGKVVDNKLKEFAKKFK